MPPTSAIGSPARRAGFTLIELVAVLFLVGLLTSAVLLSVPDSRSSLAEEAERFAAGLRRAQEEALLANRQVDVQVTEKGYAFSFRPRGWPLPAFAPARDRRFSAVDWSPGTAARVSAPDGSARITFDGVGFATPAEVSLYRGPNQARVILDPAGKVTIHAGRR